MKKRPRFSSILENDITALVAFFFALIIPACWLIIYRLVNINSKMIETTLSSDVIIVSTLAAFGLIVLVWRLLSVYSLFQKGMELPAKVTRIHLPKFGFGVIELEYNYKKTIYYGKCGVLRNFTTLTIEERKRARVIIDPKQPNHVLIRDLYI
jgi:hypothetical protein